MVTLVGNGAGTGKTTVIKSATKQNNIDIQALYDGTQKAFAYKLGVALAAGGLTYASSMPAAGYLAAKILTTS